MQCVFIPVDTQRWLHECVVVLVYVCFVLECGYTNVYLLCALCVFVKGTSSKSASFTTQPCGYVALPPLANDALAVIVVVVCVCV